MVMVLLPLKSVLVSLSIIYRYTEIRKCGIEMYIISAKVVVSALKFMHMTVYVGQSSCSFLMGPGCVLLMPDGILLSTSEDKRFNPHVRDQHRK